jgi:hypothetical protein
MRVEIVVHASGIVGIVERDNDLSVSPAASEQPKAIREA